MTTKMLNILFIGPYRQNDGWGQWSRDTLIALQTTLNYVAARPIYMCNSVAPQMPDTILEAEANSFQNYDVIIQNVLPHFFQWVETPSLGMFTLELGNIHKTPWHFPIKLMDGALVISEHERLTLKDSGYNNTFTVGAATDITKYSKDWSKTSEIPSDTFNFYFIGEFISRKNLDALIRAFHLEFKRHEPVNLIIKTYQTGVKDLTVREKVAQHIMTLKQQMRVYERIDLYKPELLMCTQLTDEEMNGLHQSCHCLVMPSHGEALCRPAIDAMGFGNTPIVTSNTGMTDFIKEDCGWWINSSEQPVLSHDAPLPWIYTARESWREPDVYHLMQCMREAYEGKNKDEKRAASLKQIENFSYTNIGSNLSKILHEYSNN